MGPEISVSGWTGRGECQECVIYQWFLLEHFRSEKCHPENAIAKNKEKEKQKSN